MDMKDCIVYGFQYTQFVVTQVNSQDLNNWGTTVTTTQSI